MCSRTIFIILAPIFKRSSSDLHRASILIIELIREHARFQENYNVHSTFAGRTHGHAPGGAKIPFKSIHDPYRTGPGDVSEHD